MDSLPPVLLLQLKRFNFDRRRGAAVKIHRSIEYPETLQLKQEYFSQDLIENIREKALKTQDAGTTGKNGNTKTLAKSNGRVSANYSLCGIILHHGEAINSGHYTSIVATGATDGKSPPYMRINDIQQTGLTASQALSARSEVYVLIYPLKQ